MSRGSAKFKGFNGDFESGVVGKNFGVKSFSSFDFGVSVFIRVIISFSS